MAAAIQVEREAHERLRASRARLATLVLEAVSAGARYDELARLSIRTIAGRSATLAERRREVDRLRQLVCRHRSMTARHDIGSREFEPAPPTRARSEGKELPMERLIKRTTVEETFATDSVDKHRAPDDDREDDDLEGDDADDEPDTAARKSRRR